MDFKQPYDRAKYIFFLRTQLLSETLEFGNIRVNSVATSKDLWMLAKLSKSMDPIIHEAL
ncbi:MAG: hypothetical protein HYZ66_00685 [Chlamydiae bacterium]|nr:hypothetical protein [Chlamydiota bacterium]